MKNEESVIYWKYWCIAGVLIGALIYLVLCVHIMMVFRKSRSHEISDKYQILKSEYLSLSQELKEAERELELSRIRNSTCQIKPHFLYNVLGSIHELILIDPDCASELLCDFTTYLRGSIRAMQNDDLVSIEREIQNMIAYVNIEKIRMESRLNIVCDFYAEDFLIVPLSIQPLVENAIRHGIYPKGRQGGTVTIRTETLEEFHLVTIQDDGVGFDYQTIRKEVASGKRDSTGLDNVTFRLNTLLNADVSIESKIESERRCRLKYRKLTIDQYMESS